MNESILVNTAAGAFVAGLLSSVHCVGMCGPLSCMMGSAKSKGVIGRFGSYHGGRLLSYTLIGLAVGWIGRAPLDAVMGSPVVLVPWMLVVALVLIGFGLDRKLPRPRWLSAWLFRSKLRLAQRSPVIAGGLIGLLTPLLPCGPLYLMIGVAALSGSASSGGEFMASFALGTMPLLWASQLPLAHWRQRWSPETLGRLRGALALLSASVIVWRLQGTLPFVETSVVSCPLCP